MILVVNAGSSSIKYTVFEERDLIVTARGQVEKIGTEAASYAHTWKNSEGGSEIDTGTLGQADHQLAMNFIAEKLLETVLSGPERLSAVGHRVVHGGEQFSDTTRITSAVKETIRALIPLAPLHNPANLLGIEIAESVFPNAIQVGVFDTAFHQTIPEKAYRYAVPKPYYQQFGIRKYGFHGTSHRYITATAQSYFNRASVNLIIAHLGNGASMTAIRAGQSVENSMGLGPLPGLVMGTRSGDIDPSLIFHLAGQHGWEIQNIETDLNKESGLKGICGHSDLRAVEHAAAAGSREAQLAIDMYVYRIQQYIGSYLATLGEVDALVFTAGVGEHSHTMRSRILEGLGSLGFRIDHEINRAERTEPVQVISAPDSPIQILVIPTDEEKQIAKEVQTMLDRK